MARKRASPHVTYEQLKPFMDSIRAGMPGGNAAFDPDTAWNAARPTSAPQADTPWDKAIHVGERVINTLGALGYGVTGTADKAITRQREQLKDPNHNQFLDLLGNIGHVPGDFIGSVGDALGGTTENLRTGSDVIENATDLAGETTNQLKHDRGIRGDDYVDTKDNVNPWVKGIGGFAIDALGDPLTYVPGGAAIGALKGANKAARAAAVAKDGGDLAKTGAMLGAVPAGAKDGFLQWAAERAAQREQKATMKLAKQDGGDGVDLGTFTPQPSVRGREPKVAEKTVTETASDIPAGVAAAAAKVDEVLHAGRAESAAHVGEKIVNDVTENVKGADEVMTAPRAFGDMEDWGAAPERPAHKPTLAQQARIAHTIAAAEAEAAGASKEAAIAAGRAAANKVRAEARKVEREKNKALAAEAAAAVAADKAAKAGAETAEVAARDAHATATADAIAAGVAKLPVSSADALKVLRGLTYTTPIDASVRKELRALKPLDREGDGEAKAAWMDHVAELVGSRDEMFKLRKIQNPDDFAVAIEGFANRTIQKSYADQPLSAIATGLKSSRRTHDEKHLAAFAKTLGINRTKLTKAEKASATPFTDYFNRVKLDGDTGVVGRIILQEKAARQSFATAIPGGAVAEEVAKTVEPAEAAAKLTEEADTLAATLDPAALAAYEASIDDIVPAHFSRDYSYKWTSKSGEKMRSTQPATRSKRDPDARMQTWKSHIFEQYKTLSYFKSVLGKGSAEAAKLGLKGADREAYLTGYVANGMKYLDTRMRSLGISPITGKTDAEAKMLKTKGEAEWAFLGMSDVLDALGPEFSRAFLFAGKDHSGIATQLHDAGRYALKLVGMPGSEADKITAMLDTLKRGLKNKITGTGQYAGRAYLDSEKGQQSLKALAGIMLDPEVVRKLTEANLRNSAYAISVVGKESAETVKPIVGLIAGRAKSPFGTGGSVSDIILKAHDDLAKGLRAAGQDDTLVAGVAKDQLEKGIAENITGGDLKRARNAQQMRNTAKDSTGGKLPDEVRQKARAEAAESAQKATGGTGKPAKPKAAVVTEARAKAAEKGAQAANTARAGEVTGLQPEIEEMLPQITGDMAAQRAASRAAEGAAEDPAEEAAADILAELATRAELSMGLPTWLRMMDKVGETFHGAFGMDRLKHHEVSLAMSSRKWTAGYNRVVNELQKRYDEPTQRAAFAIFQRMGANDNLPAALQGVDDATRQAATDLWDTVKVVFDHSDHTLFDRAGLSADYLNEYLFKAGVPEQYVLPAGTEGWALGDIWKSWEFSEDVNPIDLVKKYNAALSRAQTIPSIAASFSAQFGHRSALYGEAMTDADAKAFGWQKINTESGNGRGVEQFIDPTQYYPPEMTAQLSRMNIYLTTSIVLDGDSLFDKSFRYIDPVINTMKASITLWRPGHHMTNMMGEALMNTLAGVTNPARYGDAMSILRSQGLLDKGGEGITDFLQKNAPDGFTLKATDDGTGIWMTIGGKTSKVSHDSAAKLLEKAGVIIHHTNAEDLITDSYGLAARGGIQHKLDKISKAASPHILGQVSATRDNVFRVAQAVDILSKRSFRNIDDAIEHIGKEVHAYHPTMQTLSAREQKYVRRIAYFYTWQRQALVKVVEAMLDTPGRVTVAPKALYNISEANGTEPQSFGEPMPNDPRIPGYAAGKLTSFLWNGDQQGNALDEDHLDGSFLWSASISAPQLDILQSVFGGIAVNPDKTGIEQARDAGSQFFRQAIAGQASPLIRVPSELSSMTKWANPGQANGTPINNVGEYLLDQTGLGYASRAGLLGPRSDDPTDPGAVQARHDTTISNWFTGMKKTNETGPKAVANAYRMRQEEFKRMAEAGQNPTP